jgi:hypothetical protein
MASMRHACFVPSRVIDNPRDAVAVGPHAKGVVAMRRIRLYPRIVSLVVIALLLAAAGPALAGDSKPKPIPVHTNAYGQSYEEWATAWWQWVIGQGMIGHPLFDGTGIAPFDTEGSTCDRGQAGKVWFLAGTFGGDAERTCTIPNGKALFLPILNGGVDNVGPPIRDPLDSEEVLRKDCLAFVTDPEVLALTIDGKKVAHLDAYQIEPTLFQYTAPDIPDNIYRAFGFEYVGDVLPPGAVTCGYYVLLQPLSAGKHILVIEAENNGFSLHVTYNLTVSKPHGKGK